MQEDGDSGSDLLSLKSTIIMLENYWGRILVKILELDKFIAKLEFTIETFDSVQVQ